MLLGGLYARVRYVQFYLKFWLWPIVFRVEFACGWGMLLNLEIRLWLVEFGVIVWRERMTTEFGVNGRKVCFRRKEAQ